MNNQPHLFVFSGLPGVGKSSLAKMLTCHLKAVYLRIDTLEQGLEELCSMDVEGEGYRLSYRLAADNLRLGNRVIADCVNPVELCRLEWEQLAKHCQVVCTNILIVCSDLKEHRRRVELRASQIPGSHIPNWEQVENREFHPWSPTVLTIDTAGSTMEQSFRDLLFALLRVGALGGLVEDDEEPSPRPDGGF